MGDVPLADIQAGVLQRPALDGYRKQGQGVSGAIHALDGIIVPVLEGTWVMSICRPVRRRYPPSIWTENVAPFSNVPIAIAASGLVVGNCSPVSGIVTTRELVPNNCGQSPREPDGIEQHIAEVASVDGGGVGDVETLRMAPGIVSLKASRLTVIPNLNRQYSATA